MRLMSWRAPAILGTVLLGLSGGAWIAGEAGRRSDLERFASLAADASDAAQPDVRLWSEARVRSYQASLAEQAGPLLGVLRIERIGLTVPVREGVDAVTLNRSVGWIPGTVRPGEHGNVGLAAHRDGYFRRLGEVRAGDKIALETVAGGMRWYEVASIEIVSPEDNRSLAPSADESLTLVTCYPFYYVGSAPQRYVVRASRKGPEATTAAR